MPVPIPVYLIPASSIAELDFQEKTEDHTKSLAVASVLIIPANKHRTGAWLINDSAVVIYLGVGRPAVANKGIRLNAEGGAWEITKDNLFKGDIFGISAEGTDNIICATEIETRYAYI